MAPAAKGLVYQTAAKVWIVRQQKPDQGEKIYHYYQLRSLIGNGPARTAMSETISQKFIPRT